MFLFFLPVDVANITAAYRWSCRLICGITCTLVFTGKGLGIGRVNMAAGTRSLNLFYPPSQVGMTMQGSAGDEHLYLSSFFYGARKLLKELDIDGLVM